MPLSTAFKSMLLMGSGVGLSDYLLSLGAVLIYDGTLAGSALANRGTGGSALNGTLSNVTITDGVMQFNGTNSYIQTPASTAYANLTDFEYVIIGTPSSSAGASAGRFWNYGTVSIFGTYTRANASSRVIVGYTTTNSDVTTAASFFTGDTFQAKFLSHSSATRLTTMHRGVAGVVTSATYGTATAGVGSLLPSVADLFWGNRQQADSGYGGSMRYIAIVPRVLTADERAAVTAFV